jgi:hypothetical protein
MSDRLYSILNFAGIPIGGSATLPHGLVVNGVPVIPDRVDPPDGFDFVAGDATNVTIKNVGSVTGNAAVWVFVIHPVTRSFGLQPDDGTFQQGLVPRPFSLSTGNSPQPPFPTPQIEVTIFSRLTGNDTTGDGTLASPYRTFQRAIRDVPSIISAGVRYVVDITGIGTETLPSGYQMPVILSTAQLPVANSAPSPFSFNAPLTIRAFPQPFSGVPVANTTVPPGDIVSIVTNADNLTTITVAPARASWGADALKGAILTSDLSPNASAAIYGSDATHLFVANTSGAIPLGSTLSIVEQSATLAGPASSAPVETAAIICQDVSAIAWQGIRFRSTDVNTTGVIISNAQRPFFFLCDTDGIGTDGGIGQQLGFFSGVIRDKIVDMGGTAFTPQRCLFLNIPTYLIVGGYLAIFRTTVFDGCLDALGPKPRFLAAGAMAQPGWEITNCLFKNSGNTDAAIYLQAAGNYALENVRIQGSPGDALLAEGPSETQLTNVTGGTGGAGDPANTGAGVHATDGAFVRIRDNATLVTGTAGDMIVGTLPARTWADFRGNVPTKNQYDLQTPFVVNVASGLATPGGDDVTGAGTGGCSGSRVFQR